MNHKDIPSFFKNYSVDTFFDGKKFEYTFSRRHKGEKEMKKIMRISITEDDKGVTYTFFVFDTKKEYQTNIPYKNAEDLERDFKRMGVPIQSYFKEVMSLTC